MTTCCVPFCKRSTQKDFVEWLCPDHWKIIPTITKRTYSALKRKRPQVAAQFWDRRLKPYAIEVAAGITR